MLLLSIRRTIALTKQSGAAFGRPELEEHWSIDMAREILPDDPYVVREIHCEADRHITEEIILDCLSEDLQKYVVDCGGVKYIMKGILRSEIERTVYVFSEADLMHGGKIEETIDTKNLVNIMVEPDDAGAPHDTSVKLWIGMARWFSYQFFKTSFDFDKWIEEHDGRLDDWVICQNRMEALAHLDRLRAEGRICDNLFCQMHERILLAPDDYDVDLDSQPFVFDFLTPVENKRMDRAGGLTTMIRLVASFAMALAWRPFELYKAEQAQKSKRGSRLRAMRRLVDQEPLSSPFDAVL